MKGNVNFQSDNLNSEVFQTQNIALDHLSIDALNSFSRIRSILEVSLSVWTYELLESEGTPRKWKHHFVLV